MKTIARSATRKIAAIKETHTRCRVFSLGSNFDGHEVDPQVAWDELYRFDFARLWDGETGTGKVTVYVHSNLWYELLKP